MGSARKCNTVCACRDVTCPLGNIPELTMVMPHLARHHPCEIYLTSCQGLVYVRFRETLETLKKKNPGLIIILKTTENNVPDSFLLYKSIN